MLILVLNQKKVRVYFLPIFVPKILACKPALFIHEAVTHKLNKKPMTGILAQIITLTSFGNEYLLNGELNDFFPNHSSFEHCRSIQFIANKKKNLFSSKSEIIVAENHEFWFELLKKENCKKLRLYFQTSKADDHKSAGFVGGGGNWFIEAVYKNHSDFWISRWEPDRENNAWKVTYIKAVEKKPIINQQNSIIETKEKLKNILEKITDFAKKETSGNWSNIFETALNCLENEHPESDFYHADLIKFENYELQNRQLLMSASKSFVFGGMGSWNDMSFEPKEKEELYNSLSNELYDIMNKSIVYSINKDKIEKPVGNTV